MGEGTGLWESRRPTGPERLHSSLDYLKRMSHLHPVCNAGGVTMRLDQASGVQVYLSLACGSLTLVSLCQSGTGVLDLGYAVQGCFTLNKLHIASLEGVSPYLQCVHKSWGYGRMRWDDAQQASRYGIWSRAKALYLSAAKNKGVVPVLASWDTMGAVLLECMSL